MEAWFGAFSHANTRGGLRRPRRTEKGERRTERPYGATDRVLCRAASAAVLVVLEVLYVLASRWAGDSGDTGDSGARVKRATDQCSRTVEKEGVIIGDRFIRRALTRVP